MPTKLPLILAGCLSLASCMMVGPDFESPQPNMPASWISAPPPATSQNDLQQWWKLFNDPQLNTLIERALKDNPDVRIAILRIREARASVASSASSLLPSLGSSLGASRGSDSGLKNSSSSRFSGGLDLSWEIDLFGGNQRALDATIADFQATEMSAVAVQTSLLAEIAQTYFTWLRYTQEISLSEEQLVLQKKSLQIAEDRHKAGFVSKLDVEQALTQVANTEANLPSLHTMQTTTRNALATLLGCYPADIKLKLPSDSTLRTTPTVPLGLPSDLLRRRPDILRAELNWYASTSRVGAAISDLYPKFSLTGSLSSSSRTFADWFAQNNSGWSLGGMVRWPIFSGGSIEANVARQEALNDINAETYRKTLLTAVNEVEDALVTYANSLKEITFLKQASASSQNSAQLSLELYTAGQSDFLTVVTTQRQSLSAQSSVIAAEQRIRSNIAYLSKALGGGWSLSSPQQK